MELSLDASSTTAPPATKRDARAALIPDAVLERHIAILGKTGSGKTNMAKVLAERIMFGGGRVCVLDPTGTWWGIRLAPDGKKPSRFRPVIFGGNHADIQISAEHGAAIGEAIATASSSAIIDTRTMTVGARTKLFTAFAETLLRTNRGPLHLIIDEAHLFAPQGRVADPASGAMLHAANNLVSLGRGIGLRIILISQRPAKLHKDSLTQVETLVALRLIAPQDRRAIEDWIGEWADPGKGKEITASLPSLPTGTAWVWSPEIDLLERMKFPIAATFDSGRPPSTGSGAPELAPIDIEEIGARLGAIREQALANDPARLRRRIAELELASKQAAKVIAPDPKAIEEAEHRALERGFLAGMKVGWRHGHADAWLAVKNTAGRLEEESRELDIMPEMKADWRERYMLPALGRKAAVGAAPARASPLPPLRTSEGFDKLSRRPKRIVSAPDASTSSAPADLGAERKPLALLVTTWPGGYTEAQWASLSGYKRTGGTWGTYKSRLRVKGMVEQRGDLWFATAAGTEAIGSDMPELPDHPDERLAMWRKKLAGVGPMLDALRNVYPEALSKDDLAERLGMTASGGTFGTYLSRLRSNGLVEEGERGVYRLSPVIMGDIG